MPFFFFISFSFPHLLYQIQTHNQLENISREPPRQSFSLTVLRASVLAHSQVQLNHFLFAVEFSFLLNFFWLACHAFYFSELFQFAEIRLTLSFSIFMSCTFLLHIRLCGNRTLGHRSNTPHFTKIRKAFMYTFYHVCTFTTFRQCNHFHLRDANMYCI